MININIILREIRKEDNRIIHNSFKEQGWDKAISQYEGYIVNQKEGTRDIIIAEKNGKIAGYLTIKWISDYLPFKESGIPEIVDLNVFKKFHRLGIASALMDEAEGRIKHRSNFAGIGFGVTEDYGAAQILYIKRGYILDGRGMAKDSISLKFGEEVIVNDSLAFYLIKKLKRPN